MSFKVHVVGAGVIGLTTALMLQAQGYQVTVLAKHFPEDDPTVEYTSPWAGARWQASASDSDKKRQQIEADSFKAFWKLAGEKATESGIMTVPAYDFYGNPPFDKVNPWFKDLVPSFRVLDKTEIPVNVECGFHYTTVVVNPLIYLRWLQAQFLTMGGNKRRMTLSHISEAMDDGADVVINCTGVHVRTLGGVHDSSVVATRGQNVVVEAPHIRKTVSVKSPDMYNYIIPRSNGTVIVGTTTEPHNCGPAVDPESSKAVLEKGLLLCPELAVESKVNVVGHIVGLRPTRDNGPRIESEIKDSPSGKKVLLVHNYGHGGQGYILSWGSAKEVSRILEKECPALKEYRKSLISHIAKL